MSFYQETSVPSKYLKSVRVFGFVEAGKIRVVYGKSVYDLIAPEGYEFTGEFREPRKGDAFLTDTETVIEIEENSTAIIFREHTRLILRKIETKEPARDWGYSEPRETLKPPTGYEFTGEYRIGYSGETVMMHIGTALTLNHTDHCCRMILRKIAEPEQLALPLTPKGYTAAEVLARYGQNVLDVFGYRAGSLRDYPGFVYSGELTNVNPGEWYVYAGKVMKYENLNRSVFSSLTLIPTTPPEPRIVTFTLTAPEDFEEGEAKYIQDDLGGFMTAAGAPAGATLYSRSEVE